MLRSRPSVHPTASPLLYSTICALTLVVFSAGLYVVQAEDTLAIMERDLASTQDQLVLAWARARSDWRRVAPRPAPDATYGDQAQQVLQPLVSEIARDVVHILDVEGNPLALEMNEASDPLPISNEGLTEAADRPIAWMEISEGEESRWLIYNLPVIAEVDTLFSSESSVVGIVQLARPLADRDRSLRSMGITLHRGQLSASSHRVWRGVVACAGRRSAPSRGSPRRRWRSASRRTSPQGRARGPMMSWAGWRRPSTACWGGCKRYQQLAHALEVQRDFVADVSHELRTPLTTIRGQPGAVATRAPLPRDEQGRSLTT